MYDEILMSVQADIATEVSAVSMSTEGLQERQHLQEWILQYPNVLGARVEVVTAEYDRWQTSAGDPVLDRLDILGLDPDGRLVVAELKRDYAPHTVHMQAVNYAAMVSRLKPRDIAELWCSHRKLPPDDVEATLSQLETERLLTEASIRRPRVVIVAAGFPPSVTAAVVWLNEQGVDLSMVRYRLYRLSPDDLIVSFTRLFPVPDVEEFTIGRRSDLETGAGPEVGLPWDRTALVALAEQGNDATRAMIDLCAADEPGEVLVRDIAEFAGISDAAVRGQLAGLTMRLKNPKYGFDRRAWPVRTSIRPDSLTRFEMDPVLAALWREIRGTGHRGD